MAVDADTVRRIAHLARIELDEAALAPLAEELSAILGWIEQLNEVETDGIAPMTSVVAAALPQRPDAVTDGGVEDKVLANGPEVAEGYYVVPKVVE